MSQTPGPDPARPAGHSSAALARSSALMASGTMVSRALGLVRLVLLAGVIGLTGQAADAWQTANTLPNTIYILLAGGVLNVVFVPALTRAMARSDGGRDFSDRLITLALASLLAITVVFTLGAAVLTKFYALAWEGEQLALAVTFAYLCLPQIFCYGLYTVLGQILNSLERFGWFMWAPVANNIVAITGIVIFGALYPDASQIGPGNWTTPMILLLAGTATIGVLTQALVLLWPVYRAGFRWRPRWGFRGVGLGASSKVALWMLAVIGVSQSGMWLATNVLNRAVTLDETAPGKMISESAFLFFILPHSIITLSLVTAMFTQMSRSAHAEDYPALRSQFDHGLRLLGVAVVPVSVAMFLLAPAITTVLLFRNDIEETLATAWVTMPLLVGLAPYAAYMLASRMFHAFQDGRTPFKMQLVITGVAVTGIVIAALAPPTWTAVGISIGQMLGQSAAAVLGVIWVRRRLGGLPLRPIWATYSRVLLAAAVAAVPTLLVGLACLRWLDGRPAAWVALLVGGPLYFAVYGVVAHRAGVRELAEAADPVLRRLGRTPTRPAASVPPGQSGLGLAAQQSPSEPVHLAPAQPAAPAATEVRKERGLQGIEPGTTLGGRYVLEELLAQRGDDLDYWSASDSTLDRLVAVTVLPATGAYEQMAHNVQDGARRTAGVDDPRLVRVMDMGLEDGVCWIVEEGLAEAESLASLVSQRPLPAEEARRVVGEAASGMESARRRGLHHLFLSPHAVLRTREGTVKVSGVGVAAALEQVDDLGSTESSIIDTSDLVSLLYTALTGRWPGEEMEGLRPARRLADGSLPAPSEVVSGVPGDLDALCRQVLALDYDPRTGPRTPGELAHQLSPWPGDMVVDDRGYPPDAPVERGSAAAALTGAAGATAAGAAAHPLSETGEDITDRTPTGGAAVSDTSYYRATRSEPPADPGYGAADDGDDDYAEEEPGTGPIVPVPAGRRRDDGPGRTQSGLVIFLILAVVAGAIFLAYSFWQGMDGDPADEVPTDAVPTTAPVDTSPTTAEPTGDEPGNGGFVIGDPVTLAGITSYDPEGDQDERNDLVDFAIDGRDDTEWRSHLYLAPNWGGLKSGVGLAVDLGETIPVAEVVVTFPRGDYGAEIFVNDEATTEGGTSIGSDDGASGTWTVTAEEPVEGRYVVIWFSRAWTGPDGERVHVTDIEVKSIESE